MHNAGIFKEDRKMDQKKIRLDVDRMVEWRGVQTQSILQHNRFGSVESCESENVFLWLGFNLQ